MLRGLVGVLLVIVASAQNCKVGWPVVLGPESRDGNTVVQMWTKAPIDDDTYLIGGYSNSKDFLETKNDMCDGNCAFLTVWTSIQEKFWNRWVINEAQSLLGMTSDSYKNMTSVVVYNKETDGKHYNYIGFVYYEQNRINKEITAHLVPEVWYIKSAFDYN